MELGWIVDANLFGDTLSHLFVFHWVNGNSTCYNGCGYVQLSSTVYPGAVVQPNTMATYQIYNFNGNWILNYNGTNIGYFPGSIWNNGFTTSNFIQLFVEVDAATTNPCTDMGSSLFGTAASGAAAMIDLTLIFGANLTQASLNGVTQTNANLYSIGNIAPNAFTYGGPGGC